MLAEYGGAEWADDIAQMQLVAAWVRRKRFEAKLVAVEVGNLLAAATSGSKKVSGPELLSMAGISL
jgi:hypothetical protein